MSLYEIKKRLAVLEIFEKSTYAMKIASSSLHIKMKKKCLYCEELKEKVSTIQHLVLKKINKEQKTRCLYIFIGSEKGFCGDYNTSMMKKFSEIYKENNAEPHLYLFIGRSLIKKIKTVSPHFFFFEQFREKIFSVLQEKIKSIISDHSIDLVKTIFHKSKSVGQKELAYSDYYPNSSTWEVNPVFKTGHFSHEEIKTQYLSIHYSYLFNYLFSMSFLTEQGIRFVAMDTALKNTKEAIDKNRKLYFKTRQENINKQLQDLTASLLI